jgi:mRNA interferase MazF
MAMTGQLHSSGAIGELPVATWATAGLLGPSAVKPVFATREQSLMARHFGKTRRHGQGCLASCHC